MKKIIFFANYNLTDQGISGGDRIFIELIKNWKNKNLIVLFGTGESITVVKNYGITGIKYVLIANKRKAANPLGLPNLFIHTLNRLWFGLASVWKNRKIIENSDIIYSVSDFYPDVLPSFFARLLNPRIKWIAAFYLFAPSPWSKENPYTNSILRRVTGFLYWFTQLFSYCLIKFKSDFVVSCNEIDRLRFIKNGYKSNKIVSIYGGVNLAEVKIIPSPKKKLYDLVFMARLHVQKGPLVALEVLKHLVKIRPNVKLALIGNGPEESRLINYIKLHKLHNNVFMLGFLDGAPKYHILKSSKIFIHPAIYETGGMAAAEGMAAGLPVVAFDHDGFDYCYPKGMIRVSPVGDSLKMSSVINELLKDRQLYSQIKSDALDLVKSWDWKARSKSLMKSIERIL